MFNTDSVYRINEIVFGITIPGPDSDYGVFVLRGEAEYSHKRILILAIMKTDGKTFWPIASDVKDEESFFKDPLITVHDRNLSVSLQRTPDGNLVASLFSTEADGTVTEISNVITLPVKTSIRAK